MNDSCWNTVELINYLQFKNFGSSFNIMGANVKICYCVNSKTHHIKPTPCSLEKIYGKYLKKEKIFDFSEIKNEGDALNHYSVRVENPTVELVELVVAAPAPGLSEFTIWPLISPSGWPAVCTFT